MANEEAKLFVAGLPDSISEDVLKQLFEATGGTVVNVSLPIPTAPTLTGATMVTNGTFQFAFTNSVGALFGVLAATNVALPFGDWTALGGVRELSPGRFQFSDLQATNGGQRFYRVRSP